MAKTRMEVVYDSLHNELEKIMNENQYCNISKAFAVWFLKNHNNKSETEAEEMLVDGTGDNGIDAYEYIEDSKTLIIFQFKFPDESYNTNSEIKAKDINATFKGVKVLLGKAIPDERSNNDIKDAIDNLKNNEIDNCSIYFVSFNKGIVTQRNTLLNLKQEFDDLFLKPISVRIYTIKEIVNLYDKVSRGSNIKIDLEYETLEKGVIINNENVSSFVGFVNAKKLISNIADVIEEVFNENIRLFEIDSPVNNNIYNTAKGNDSNRFYFYNNGITFICSDYNISLNSNIIHLYNSSIVNGCQTVNSLYKAYRENVLREDVNILVRIIQEQDYEYRSLITRNLNTQNDIKSSYYFANETTIINLQRELFAMGWFLERQINEAVCRPNYNGIKVTYDKYKIINMEDAIQFYVGYYLDNLAHISKAAKGELFNEQNKNLILDTIDCEKVIESYLMHEKITTIVKKYRRHRRNDSNVEFSQFLDITASELNKVSNDYSFINTGDILILNMCKHVKCKFDLKEDESLIRKTIMLIKDYILINNIMSKYSSATYTKSKEAFLSIKEYILSL